MLYFAENDKLILKYMWKSKALRIAKTSLNKNNRMRGQTVQRQKIRANRTHRVRKYAHANLLIRFTTEASKRFGC